MKHSKIFSCVIVAIITSCANSKTIDNDFCDHEEKNKDEDLLKEAAEKDDMDSFISTLDSSQQISQEVIQDIYAYSVRECKWEMTAWLLEKNYAIETWLLNMSFDQITKSKNIRVIKALLENGKFDRQLLFWYDFSHKGRYKMKLKPSIEDANMIIDDIIKATQQYNTLRRLIHCDPPGFEIFLADEACETVVLELFVDKVKEGDVDISRLLLNSGKINKCTLEQFLIDKLWIEAAELEHLNVLDFFLENFTISKTGFDTSFISALRQSYDVVKFFLDRGLLTTEICAEQIGTIALCSTKTIVLLIENNVLNDETIKDLKNILVKLKQFSTLEVVWDKTGIIDTRSVDFYIEEARKDKIPFDSDFFRRLFSRGAIISNSNVKKILFVAIRRKELPFIEYLLNNMCVSNFKIIDIALKYAKWLASITEPKFEYEAICNFLCSCVMEHDDIKKDVQIEKAIERLIKFGEHGELDT